MKPVTYLLYFIFILLINWTCNREKSPESISTNACDKKRTSIILFVDVDTEVGSYESDKQVREKNKKRIKRITDEIKSKLFSTTSLYPFDLYIFPLGSNSAKIEPIFAFSSKDEHTFNYCDDNADRVAVRRMQDDFSPTRFLNNSKNGLPKGENSLYKQIYLSVKPLFHKLKNLNTKKVIIFYYSDFIERRGPQNSIKGKYLFKKPYSRLQPSKFALDCNAIDTTQSDLEKEELPLSKTVQKYNIGKTNFQGKIQVYLIKDTNPLEEVKLDNCENQELLDEYWEAFFSKLGLEPESQLNWVSVSDVSSVLLK